MYKKKNPVRHDCGLHLFKELLSGKWKLMLLFYVSDGCKRPSELERKIGTADRRVLANQLQELVRHGFLERTVFEGKVPRTEYELTPLGRSLLPVILTLESWGEEHRGALEKAMSAS
jgi:DNA-binding HxlR family transcriptional regulator